jgi:hypothetical protein
MSSKGKWNKYTLPMPPNHGWKCSAGHNLFIADRGAVRFEFPEAWTHGPEDDGSIGFHDRKPPADDVSLRASVLHLPPGLPMAALDRDLPLDKLIVDAVARDTRGVAFDGRVHRQPKPDAQVVWVHMTFTDPAEQRAARSRMCMARARGVQPLITMDYWDDQAAQFEPVWDHVMRTLWVATPIAGVGGESAN